MRTTTIKIDGKKLEKELAKRHLTKAGTSKELGYTTAWMGGVIRNGVIAKSGMMLLEQKYHIKYDDIKVEETPPIVKALEEIKEEKPPIDYEMLMHTIKRSVPAIDYAKLGDEMVQAIFTAQDAKFWGMLQTSIAKGVEIGYKNAIKDLAKQKKEGKL